MSAGSSDSGDSEGENHRNVLKKHRRTIDASFRRNPLRTNYTTKSAIKEALQTWTPPEEIAAESIALFSSAFFILPGSNPFRAGIHRLVKSWPFEGFIMLIIVVNCVLLAIQDPTQPDPDWSEITDAVFTSIFTAEMLLKWIAFGLILHPGSYFRDSWNVLDFVIVILSYINYIPGVGNYTAIRALKVLRPLRSMNKVKGLKTLVVCLFHSFGGLIHVLALAFFIFCIFGILGVQLWGGLFKRRCFDLTTNQTLTDRFCAAGADSSELLGVDCDANQICIPWENPHYGFTSFDNVLAAFLIIFQVIAFDGWTDILSITYYVYGRPTIIYFFILIMFGAFFLPNLALAVINDKYNEAQARQHKQDIDDRELKEWGDEIARRKSLRIRGPDAVTTIPKLVLESAPKGTSTGVPVPLTTRNILAHQRRKSGECAVVEIDSDDQTTTVMKPKVMKADADHNPNGSAFASIVPSSDVSDQSKFAKGGSKTKNQVVVPGIVVLSTVASSSEVSDISMRSLPGDPDRGLDGISPTRSNPSDDPAAGGETPERDHKVSFPSHQPFEEDGDSNRQLLDGRFRHADDGSETEGCCTMPWSCLVVRDKVHIFTEGYSMFHDVAPRLKTWRERMQTEEEGSPSFFTWFIVFAIVCNTIMLASAHYNQPDWMDNVFSIANIVFTAIFAAEFCIRFFALGPYFYFRDPFNGLDFLIVVFSLVELLSAGSRIVSVFRAFRLLRILKLVKRFRSLRVVVRVALGALTNTLYLNIIFFLFLTIGALAGMQLFGGDLRPLEAKYGIVIRSTFDNFLWAFYTVFQVVTRDNWEVVMWNSMEATSEAASIFFIVTVLIGSFVILNLFLAILISSFAQEEEVLDSAGSLREEEDAAAEEQRKEIRERMAFDVGEALNLLPPEDPTGQIRISEALRSELQQAESTMNATPTLHNETRKLLSRGPLGVAQRNSSVFLTVPPPRGTSSRRKQSRLSMASEMSMICRKCKSPMNPALPTPPLVKEPSLIEFHDRSCWLASIRTLRTSVVNSIQALVQIKVQANAPFDQNVVQIIFDDLHRNQLLMHHQPEDVNAWSDLEALLAKQYTLLSFMVGEEQVGRALTSYVRAGFPKDHKTNGGNSLICLSPTNKFRLLVSEAVSHPFFDRCVLLCILLSCILLTLDVPSEDHTSLKYDILFGFDVGFTAIFVIEMLMKIIALGLLFHDTAYLRDPWNVADCLIVLISIVSLAVVEIDIGWIKVFRAFRALRPLRVIQRNRGLKMVVRTLMLSVKGIANVALLSGLCYLIFGILAVQLFAGKLQACTDPTVLVKANCTGFFYDPFLNATVPRTWQSPERNYDNIAQSVLALFEVSSGSQWTDIMYAAIDAQSDTEAPARDSNPWVGLFFVAFMIISNFFLLNLFVGVVINNFNSVKSRMDGLQLLSDEQKLWVETQRLMLNFRPSPLLAPSKGSLLSRICDKIVRRMEFELVISVCILLNILAIALDHDGMDANWDYALTLINYIFVAIFCVEFLLKFVAYRFRYFSMGWNRFDFFIVIVSFVGIILTGVSDTELPINPGLLRVFRIFRLLRVLRLVKKARHVRVLIETLWYSLPSIGNISIFMLLIYFVFAVLGVQFFAKVQPGEIIDDRFFNFQHFPNALQVMFIMTTGEDWNSYMYDCMVEPPYCEEPHCGSPAAPLYFVPFVVISAFVISNLFIAIILDNFNTTMKLDQSNLKLADLHRYVEIWSEFDPDATMTIPTRLFPQLLARLRPPLGISRAYSRREIINKTHKYRVPEHGGQIHFVEVLIPLARVVMNVTFTERELRAHEAMWRLTFPDLDRFPILRYRQEMVTVEKYFCSTYIAAAMKRKRAKEQLALLLERTKQLEEAPRQERPRSAPLEVSDSPL